VWNVWWWTMYEHDFQLKKLLLVRDHALLHGKQLAWIDLRPKTNNPGAYLDGSAVHSRPVQPVNEHAVGVDASTQSILDRDN